MIAGSLATAAERLRAGGEPYVHATVVRAQHPTSVHAGDAAIVHPDGTVDGFVGGHCALESVRLHAAQVLATGEPLLLRIVPEPEEEEPREGVVIAHNPCLSGGAFEVFLEPWLPAPRLVVVGEAPMARALAELGRAAGYEVDAGGEPQPGDAAVVVSSHGEGEEQALTRALRAGVPYVALVASRRRGEAVRASLDVPEELRERVHVPAGLDIGARTPVEVAVSILAQLIAERAPRDAAAPRTDAHCCHEH
jgi:xanthine dehydrogenase accessory factor